MITIQWWKLPFIKKGKNETKKICISKSFVRNYMKYYAIGSKGALPTRKAPERKTQLILTHLGLWD